MCAPCRDVDWGLLSASAGTACATATIAGSGAARRANSRSTCDRRGERFVSMDRDARSKRTRTTRAAGIDLYVVTQALEIGIRLERTSTSRLPASIQRFSGRGPAPPSLTPLLIVRASDRNLPLR